MVKTVEDLLLVIRNVRNASCGGNAEMQMGYKLKEKPDCAVKLFWWHMVAQHLPFFSFNLSHVCISATTIDYHEIWYKYHIDESHRL